MPKVISSFVCQQCGFKSPTYLGKCPECGTWNSLVEQVSETSKRPSSLKSKILTKIVNLKDIEKESYPRIDTQISEFNRVLGGGIVVGSIILVSGDPGIGKSTLLTQLALSSDVGRSPRNDGGGVLYVAGEESAQQIKIRADRISKSENLSVLNETDIDVIVRVIEELKPPLVIIDSIQSLETDSLTGAAGSVGQVRECTHLLQKLAKRLHVPIILVGHVTKEGTVAGPRTLEHIVDVVLSMEGDANGQFRILRSQKNRFGPTDEVGIFDMEENGLVEVINPSKLFLDQKVNAPGSVVVPILTGDRPMLVEIQALVTKTNLTFPRRTGVGIDNNKLQLLVAVLQKRLGLALFDQDIFVNVTGGLKIMEPAVDLGICLSIISSFKDLLIKPKTVFIGEVGLLGELRQVRRVDKRSTEAKKLGFINVISPEQTKSLAQVIKLAFVDNP